MPHPNSTMNINKLESNHTNTLDSFSAQLHKILQPMKIVPHIPKGARQVAAFELTKRINAINANPSVLDNWRKLFTFSRECLAISKKNKINNLTEHIKQLIVSSTGSLIPEKAQWCSEKRSKSDSKHTLAKQIERKINDGDVKGAVRLASSNDSLASNDVETLQSLREKHPLSTSISTGSLNDLFLDVPPQMIVSNINTIQAIRSFSPGSSGGLSGLRPQHLKELTSSHIGFTG